tara:strand:- start:1084 stop:1554 length:471 start_codon:yes stop_codon:yes gene_type:complete
MYSYDIMESVLEEEITKLEEHLNIKHEEFLAERTRLDLEIHNVQTDINEGLSKIPRIELIKQQDKYRDVIKKISKSFIENKGSIETKIDRLEDSRNKLIEDSRLEKESVEHNINNIQGFVDRGNTNEVFLAIDAVKNSLILMNNQIKEITERGKSI